MKYVDQECLTYAMANEDIGASSVKNCISKYGWNKLVLGYIYVQEL